MDYAHSTRIMRDTLFQINFKLKRLIKSETDVIVIKKSDYDKRIKQYSINQQLFNKSQVLTSVKSNISYTIIEEHPAPFPEEIITLPILQTSKEFELVLDPFMGSGTVGRVCDKLERSFVGYDLIIY